jgi:hypothetical protein
VGPVVQKSPQESERKRDRFEHVLVFRRLNVEMSKIAESELNCWVCTSPRSFQFGMTSPVLYFRFSIFTFRVSYFDFRFSYFEGRVLSFGSQLSTVNDSDPFGATPYTANTSCSVTTLSS